MTFNEWLLKNNHIESIDTIQNDLSGPELDYLFYKWLEEKERYLNFEEE